jgi:hypothetical protein
MSCTSFLIVSYIPVTEDIRQDAKAVLHPEQLTKIAAAVEIPVFARTVLLPHMFVVSCL